VVSDAWGWYASIFFWLFFTGIGLPPFPEEAGILYAAGLTALHPEVRWWLAWPATMAGILAADMVLYGVGYRWGPRLFEHAWVQRFLPTERRRRMETRFHQHGVKILLTARMLPPLRSGAFLVAGAIRYPFRRFLIADSLYLIFGVGVFFFGSTWLINLVRQADHWLVYVLAAAAAALTLYGAYHYLHQRGLQVASGPEPAVSALSDCPAEGPGNATSA
jgi:membrane protein DedA with SNARE-associated domain